MVLIIFHQEGISDRRANCDLGIPELLPDPEDAKAKGKPIVNTIAEQDEYVPLILFHQALDYNLPKNISETSEKAMSILNGHSQTFMQIVASKLTLPRSLS